VFGGEASERPCLLPYNRYRGSHTYEKSNEGDPALQNLIFFIGRLKRGGATVILLEGRVKISLDSSELEEIGDVETVYPAGVMQVNGLDRDGGGGGVTETPVWRARNQIPDLADR